MNQIADLSLYPPHIRELIEKQRQLKATVEADRLTMPVQEGAKTAQLREYLHRRLAVEISDGRRLEGRFMSYDKQQNIVLTECVEIRRGVPISKPSGN